MAPDLNFPSVDREVFPNPPLKVMLGQVRFPTLLRIAELASLVPFQEAVRHEFPTYREEQQLSLIIVPQGPQAPQIQKAHRFITSDGAWSILLTPDAVTLEADPVTASYASYDQFVERFRLVWQAIIGQFAPGQVTRQGLRYVDHIEGDRSAPEWAAIINRDLLGPAIDYFGETLAQSVSELRLNRDDGGLIFKHGMLPLGPNNTPGYLLDFDYFTETPDNDTSLEAVMGRFDRYHATLYEMFRWCVTDEALEIFRGNR